MEKIIVSHIRGDEYQCYCPLHEDDVPSLGVNVVKGVAYCFAGCFEGKLVDLIKKAWDLHPIIAWRRMITGEIFDFSEEGTGKYRKGKAKYSSPIIFGVNGVSWLPGDCSKYLLDRGFSRSTIRYWDIEYSPEINHIRIPIIDKEQNLKCFSFRAIDSDVKPKYLHPGFKKYEGWLFGEHLFESIGGWVNLVEGGLDCVWLWQCGWRNTLAFLGVPTDKQMETIHKFGSNFRLCFDNDKGGQSITEKMVKYLLDSNYDKNTYKIAKLPEGKKDVQEICKDELEKIIL